MGLDFAHPLELIFRWGDFLTNRVCASRVCERDPTLPVLRQIVRATNVFVLWGLPASRLLCHSRPGSQRGGKTLFGCLAQPDQRPAGKTICTLEPEG